MYSGGDLASEQSLTLTFRYRGAVVCSVSLVGKCANVQSDTGGLHVDSAATDVLDAARKDVGPPCGLAAPPAYAIEYRRCDLPEDLEAVFKLRYKAYHGNGLIPPNPVEMFRDVYDKSPNRHIFAVYCNGHMVSTIRLHVVTKETPVSPTYDLFSDVLGPRIAAGETFIDPTRFAADPDWTPILRFLPQVTLRLAVAACAFYDVTSCLTMVREEHAGFYRRYFHANRIADPRAQPNALAECALFESRCDINMKRTIERFPIFESSPRERQKLFARVPAGQVSPLTIIPKLSVELNAG